MEKEKCLENFKEMIKQSWTYARLSKEEKKRLFVVFDNTQTKNSLKGNYKQRWETLQAIYTSFLMALDYKPIGWRED